LGAKIRTSFLQSDRTYGARRVWHGLLAEGEACGLHRVERLMRRHAWRARPRRRRVPAEAGPPSPGVVSPNVLHRQFDAPAPNRKGVADFTYLWTAEGWLSVAAVVDLFSRRVVGWSMPATMTAQLVTDALVMAIWRRGKPDAVLPHSDRGSQYTSEPFQRLLADQGLACRMSRAGNCWDNAAMESFFSSLKTERTAHTTYRTREEAKADVFDYIERFSNPRRRHSTLGYLSPMEFERQAELAEDGVHQTGSRPAIGVKMIGTDDIHRNPYNPRLLFDPERVNGDILHSRRAAISFCLTPYVLSVSGHGKTKSKSVQECVEAPELGVAFL
jgi:putative transposase